VASTTVTVGVDLQPLLSETGKIGGVRVTGGPEAEERLDAALARVADALPYLRGRAGQPSLVLRPGEEVKDGQWFCCDELLDAPEWLEATIRAMGQRLGAPGVAVAASVFVQDYAYRVLTMGLSCLFLGDVLPASRPGEMAMAMSNGRPAFVYYRTPKILTAGEWRSSSAGAADALHAYLEDAIEGHMRPLVMATLACVQVGRRLLWGNVASSAAVAFRTMEGLIGPEVKPLGEQFFSTVPEELKGLGHFATVEHAGRSAWYWERRNCCLYDRLPDKIRCTDCSKTSAEERRASYRAALEHGGG
jgi:ferric iron reductase protein FhuF